MEGGPELPERRQGVAMWLLGQAAERPPGSVKSPAPGVDGFGQPPGQPTVRPVRERHSGTLAC
jgi:hypothetical protein